MGVDDNTKKTSHLDCKTLFDHEDGGIRHLLGEHGTPVSPRAHELYTCTICRPTRHFDYHRTLQIHLKMHQSSDKIVHQMCQTTNNQRLPSGNEETLTTGSMMEIKPAQNDTKTSKEQLRFQCSAAAKKVGLKKIRLEDCFRCDACSCIYLEEGDYRKHMRNFHRDPLQKQKQKKACKSCCRHCNCNGDHNRPTENITTSSNNLHFNIKDRWRKMVSTRMDPTKTPISIKTETELEDCNEVLDYSHLLSQVEVRIKTEPEDDTEHV